MNKPCRLHTPAVVSTGNLFGLLRKMLNKHFTMAADEHREGASDSSVFRHAAEFDAAEAEFRIALLAAIEDRKRLEDDRTRDDLGRIVREVWIAWALEQPQPKPSWLVPYDQLSEPDREVDRRIGERLFREGLRVSIKPTENPYDPSSPHKPPEGWEPPEDIFHHDEERHLDGNF